MTRSHAPTSHGRARRRRMAACLLLAGAGHALGASPLGLSCLGCHQPQVDAPTMPSLARQPAASLAAALRAARDHPQPGSIMARFAAALSDADIEALARELGKAD